MKIICADDMYYNLETLKIVFQNLGLLSSCEFVNDGRQALERCIKCVEDSDFGQKYETLIIVILDFEMPNMTGLNAIKMIKGFYDTIRWNVQVKNPKYADARNFDPENGRAANYPTFCMYSQHSHKGFREFVLDPDRGVDYIIQKPLNLEEIYEIVVNAVNKQ